MVSEYKQIVKLYRELGKNLGIKEDTRLKFIKISDKRELIKKLKNDLKSQRAKATRAKNKAVVKPLPRGRPEYINSSNLKTDRFGTYIKVNKYDESDNYYPYMPKSRLDRVKNVNSLFGSYLWIDNNIINVPKDIDTVDKLYEFVNDNLKSLYKEIEKEWIFISHPNYNKSTREEKRTVSTKFIRLGVSKKINCFINLVAEYITEDDFNTYKHEKFISTDDIETLARKNGFHVKFYDALKLPWHTIDTKKHAKTLKFTVTNEHVLSSSITPCYYERHIYKSELNKATLRYHSKSGKIIRAFNLQGSNIVEIRNKDNYIKDTPIIQNFMNSLRKTLYPDNHYTKDIQFFYPNYININNRTINTIHSYDSSNHFYRHTDSSYFAKYKYACPPTNRVNNTSDISYLDYSGFVDLLNYKSLSKIASKIFHINCSYPTFLIKYALDKKLISDVVFSISYALYNHDVNLNSWFDDKEFTKKQRKEIYTHGYGMLRKATVDKRLSYISIHCNTDEEVNHFINHPDYMFTHDDTTPLNKTNYKIVNIKQSPHELKYTNNAYWLYIINYALTLTLDFYLSINENNIAEIYVDSIRTYSQLKTIPPKWKYEGTKRPKIQKEQSRTYEYKEFPATSHDHITVIMGKAGCGKSFNTFKNITVDEQPNTILLCPQRSLIAEQKKVCLDHKFNIPNTSTYHSFFSINTKYSVNTRLYTHVILDEMGMISPETYTKYIKPFFDANPHIRQTYIFGENQLNSDSGILQMLQSINNAKISSVTKNYRIKDPVLKSRVDTLHDTYDIVTQIELFKDRLVLVEDLAKIKKPEDLLLVSKNKLHQMVENYKPRTFHSTQGKTIKNNKLFVLLAHLFDKNMLSVSVTRLQQLNQLYLVADKSTDLLTKWDYFLIHEKIQPTKEEPPPPTTPLKKYSKKEITDTKLQVFLLSREIAESSNPDEITVLKSKLIIAKDALAVVTGKQSPVPNILNLDTNKYNVPSHILCEEDYLDYLDNHPKNKPIAPTNTIYDLYAKKLKDSSYWLPYYDIINRYKALIHSLKPIKLPAKNTTRSHDTELILATLEKIFEYFDNED